jgi:hypothetical protein
MHHRFLADTTDGSDRIDVAATVIAALAAADVMAFAASLRDAGLRNEVHLAASCQAAQVGRNREARFALIYGTDDKEAGAGHSPEPGLRRAGAGSDRRTCRVPPTGATRRSTASVP